MALSTDAGGAPSIVLTPGVDGKVHVPHSDFLYGATFIRSGSDLKLVGEDGQTILVPRYFESDAPPALVAPDNSGLSGETVSLLAGPAYPGQYAQANAADAPAPIGEVVKAEGEAQVQRVDGTKEPLDKGDPIFQNDVVEVIGSSLGIRFSDGTVFNMSAGTKMVINNLVYDPDGASNSALFNIVKGTFAMVGGKIVDSGEMDVATPIATMGIRGTAVACGSLGSGGSFCGGLPGHDNVIEVTTEAGNPKLGEGEIVTSAGIVGASQSQLAFLSNQAKGLKEVEDEDDAESSSIDDFQEAPIKAPEDPERGGPEDRPGPNPGLPQQNKRQQEEESTDDFLVQQEEEPAPVINNSPIVVSNPPVAEDDFIAGDEDNAVVEAGAGTAGSPQVTGNVLENDSGDGLTVVSIGASPAIPVTGAGTTIVGTFGSLQVFPDGSYAYTLDNTDPDTQALAQGEQGFEFFVYTIADISGATAAANLTITVNGANDAPVAVADNNTDVPDPVVEDGDSNASGNVLSNDIDVDNGAVLTVAAVNGDSIKVGVAVAGTYGSVLINSDGSYVYTLDNTVADTQALAEGEVVTEEFQYTVTDEYGTADATSLTVTIVGVNDGATITGTDTGTVTEDGATDSDANTVQVVQGQLTVTDPDDGENVFLDPGVLTRTYGTFTFNTSTGAWDFTLDNTAAQSLTAGEEVTETLTVTSADDTATEDIVVTIVGVNDGATITGTDTGTVTEDGATDSDANTVQVVQGQLTVTDPDDGENVFLDPGVLTRTYGTFTFNTSTGAWDFTLDNTAAQSLTAGEEVTETLTVTSADDTATEDIVVTIVGVNDGATITGTDTGTVTEDGATDSDANTVQVVQGQLTVTDPDDGENVFLDPGVLTRTYGTFTFNTSTGAWDFTLDNTAAQSLTAGEEVTETLTVTSADDTATEDIVVTIVGVNDGATITGTDTGTVTEDGATDSDANTVQVVQGQLTVTDPDDGENVFLDPGVLTRTYGTFTFNTSTGAWDFTLDNTAAQSLTAGEEVTETLTVTSADDTATEDIVVTIVGVNDGATITGTDTGTVTEDGATDSDANTVQVVQGQLTVTDPDDGENVFLDPGVLTRTYGTFTFNTSTGAWDFTLDNTAAQSLTAGEEVTETLTVTSADDTATEDIVVTIVGVNDGATITGTDTGTVTEDGATDSDANTVQVVQGQLTVTDPDDGENVFLDPGVLTRTYGTFTFNTSTGAWDFTLDNTAAQSLTAGEEVTETLTVTSADDTATEDIVVTIVGVNDGATITGTDTGTVTEDGATDSDANTVQVVQGQLTVTDPDDGENVFLDPGVLTRTYGTFTFNTSTGAWDFTLDNTAAQSLTAGEEVTETLTVTSADDTATEDIVVTIVGVNDGATITGTDTGTVTEDGATDSDANTVQVVQGQLTVTDPDDGENVFLDPGVLTRTYGTFTFNTSTGAWDFTLDNTAAQSLTAGEEVTETLTVTSADDTATEDIVVTIVGVNDGATITGTDTGTVTEDGATDSDANTVQVVQGQLTVTDPDDGENVFLDPGVLTRTYGTFTFNTSTGAWDFTLDNTAAQSLTAGEEVTETLTVTSADDTATEDIVVTIVGVNDGATITGTDTGTVTEDGATDSDANTVQVVQGQLTVTDPDDGENVFLDPGVLTRTYGTFTFNTSTGAWDFTLDNTAAQSLTAGEEVTETLTVTSADDTATEDIVVTIVGVNDGATITGTDTGTVTEDGATDSDANTVQVVQGQLTVTDPDDGENVFLDPGVLTRTYGTFTFNTSTGAWDFTLDNTAAQSLTAGEEVTETLTVTSADDTATEDIVVTIVGVNDGATITGTDTGTVTEDGATDSDANTVQVVQGQLTVTDPDDGENVFLDPGVLTRTYGTFTFNTSTGAWDFTLDNTAAQSLTAGEEVTETLTVTSADDTATEDIVVTIVGVNDLPTGGGTVSLTVSEAALDTDLDSADLSAGVVTGTDPTSTEETDQATSGIAFTAGAGEAITISFADPDASESGWIAPTVSGLTSGYSLSWAVNSEGELVGTLIGPGDVDLGPAIYLALSGQISAASGDTATPTVTTTLTDQLQHALDSDEVTITGIKVVATDTSGDQVSGDVNVTVYDDMPAIGVFADQTILNEVGTLTQSFSLTPGADGIDHFNITGPSLSGVAYSSSTTTVGGVTTTTLTATAGGDAPTTLFTLAVREDGTYTFSLVTPDAGSTESFSAQNLAAGNNTDVETPDGRIEFSSSEGINSNKDGFGVGNQFVGKNQSFTLEFHDPGNPGFNDPVNTDPDLVDAVSLVVSNLNGAGGTYNWVATNTLTGDVQEGTITINSIGSYLIDPTISFNQLQVAGDNDVNGQGAQFSSIELTKEILPENEELNFTVQAVDGDGDTATSSLEIKVVADPTEEDPILLDLGNEGIDLSHSASFDLNADGQSDTLAWTDGQDGILVMDLDGSGAIEDGTEVLSPYFNEGIYTDALDALRSLDENGDGIIDSNDSAFADLRVWQDINQDGVTDGGELKSLGDLGITSIDLNALAASGTIDGQQVLAEGTFTYADGQTGDYIMVALGEPSADGTEGTTSTDSTKTTKIKLNYSQDAGDRGVIVNLSSEPAQANIGYGIATAAALTALDTFGDEQALADDVQEVVGTNNEDALFAGMTSVTFDALDGDDSLRGSSEDDTLIGGAGDDLLAGAGGADSIDGGSGTDTVDYADSTSGVSINLDDAGNAATAASSLAAPEEGDIGGGLAEGDSLTGIENIVGSSQGDVLTGNALENRLDGGVGDDVLRGEAGNDTLLGGEGNDMLFGGEGNDTLVGGPGNDTLDGGDGTDTVDYGQEGGPHGVIVNLSDAPVTADIGDGSVEVAANSAIDTFGDVDLLSGIDNIIGTEHRDVLVGAGNGVKLTGGGGADSFVLTGTDIADLIVDYNQAEGDAIDLTTLYQEFASASSENANVSATQFISEHVQYDPNTGTLSVDMDGDGANGYEQQVATVNSSVSADTSTTAAAYVPDSVTLVVEDESASTPIV